MTKQRSLFAELDDVTDGEIHERIKPNRPPATPRPKPQATPTPVPAHSTTPTAGRCDAARRLELHAAHPGCLLLFRCGDFYELFDEDAVTASKLIGLTLTTRDKASATPTPIPMAGFPYHQLDNYLRKLVRSGQRCAICETMTP